MDKPQRPKFRLGDDVLAEVTKDGAKRLARINEILPDGWYGIRFMDSDKEGIALSNMGMISGFQRHEDDLELVERKVQKFVWVTKRNGKIEEM